MKMTTPAAAAAAATAVALASSAVPKDTVVAIATKTIATLITAPTYSSVANNYDPKFETLLNIQHQEVKKD